jgi:hypothetical protein
MGVDCLAEFAAVQTDLRTDAEYILEEEHREERGREMASVFANVCCSFQAPPANPVSPPHSKPWLEKIARSNINAMYDAILYTNDADGK